MKNVKLAPAVDLALLAARTPESALVHDHWADNVFLETFVDVDIGKAHIGIGMVHRGRLEKPAPDDLAVILKPPLFL